MERKEELWEMKENFKYWLSSLFFFFIKFFFFKHLY